MQVPAPFAYERATSVDHAISLLEQLGPEARVIAGGHSLLPMMKLRLARPEHLIDINDLVGELGAIAIDGDDLVIGAMARHADLLASAVAGEHFPRAARRRARHCRPGRAQPGHDRRVALPGRSGRGPLGRALGAPRRRRDPVGHRNTHRAGARAAHRSVRDRRRRRRDAHRDPGADPQRLRQCLREARAACRRLGDRRRRQPWCGWRATRSPTPASACAPSVPNTSWRPRAEGHLRGQQASEEVIVAAAAIAAEDCNPTTDQRGPAEYKRHLAGELTARALRRAVARAKGQEA